MAYIIGNKYSKRLLIHAKGFLISNDIQNDLNYVEPSRRVQQVTKTSSNNIQFKEWNDKDSPLSENDIDIHENINIMPVENISKKIRNPLVQECKPPERILFGNWLSSEYDIGIHKHENAIEEEKECENVSKHLSQMNEHPAKDIYLYDTFDDSSVSTLGSLSSHPLPKGVSHNTSIPILKGSWNDEKIVTILYEGDNDCSSVNQDIVEERGDNLSKDVFNCLPQGCKQRDRDLLSNLVSGEYDVGVSINEDAIEEGKECESLPNHPSRLYKQPVREIYLYDRSDGSSVSTLNSLSNHPLPKAVSIKVPLPILKGSWNDEKIITVLLPDVLK